VIAYPQSLFLFVNLNVKISGDLTANGTFNAVTGIYNFESTSSNTNPTTALILAGNITLLRIEIDTNTTVIIASGYTSYKIIPPSVFFVFTHYFFNHFQKRGIMKKILMRNIIILCLLVIGIAPQVFSQVTRHAVAAGGNWNSTSTWAATVGGAAGASVPVAGDIVNITNGAAVTVDIANAACATLNIRSTATGAGGTLNFLNSSSGLTVSGNVNVLIPNSGKTTLNVGSGTLTVGGNITLDGTTGNFTDVTIGTGTINVTGNTIVSGASSRLSFTGAGTIKTAGNFLSTTATGTFTAGAGKIECSNSAQRSLGAYTYNNIDITGTGIVLLTGATTINGTFNNTPNNQVKIEGNLTVGGTFNAGTGLYTFQTNSSTISGTFSLPKITVESGITVTNSGTLTNTDILNIDGTLTNNGILTKIDKDFNVNSGGTLTNSGTINKNTGAFNNSGTFNNNTGGTFTNTLLAFGNTGTINNEGTITLSGGATTVGGTVTNSGTINANSSAGQTFSGTLTNTGTISIGASLTNSGTLTNNNTITKTTGTFSNSGTFNNNTGSTLTNTGGGFTNTNIITNAGTIALDAGAVAIDGTVSNSGTINANSGAGQTFSGTLTNTGTISTGTNLTNSGTITNNGTITKTAGTLTLTGILNNNGVFSNTGAINCSAGSTLNCAAGSTLTNNSTITITPTVTLTFAGTYNGTGSFTGDLFTNTGVVAPGSTTDILSFSTGFTNSGTLNMEINGTTTPGTDYDRINVNGGNARIDGTINLTFGYTPVAGDKIRIVFVAAGGTYSGAATVGTTTGLPTGLKAVYIPATGNIEITTVTPVELVKFEAKKGEGKAAILSWTTASEKDNARFDIEHSTDGRSFAKIGEVKGNGTTYTAVDYSFEHPTPAKGVNYYRLHQIDYDGKNEYSPVRSFILGGKGLIVKNTLAKEAVTVVTDIESPTVVNIYNSAGQQVISNKTVQGEYMLDISALQNGLYIIRTTTGDVGRFTKL
jgi:hypothetical protein